MPRRGWIAFALAIVFLVVPAATRADDANLLGLPEKAVKAGGRLVLCGGGDLPEAVYEEFVELAGGKSARIVFIPTAYPFSSPAEYRRSYSGWFDYQLKSFRFLDTDSRETADTEQFAKPLETATGVWIGGGAQGRLADIYGGTRVEAALRGVLERGGVIGGTSAGASVVSRRMIRSGPATEANCSEGLGLLKNVIVDQHFSQRGRHTRLLGCMRDHPDLLCLGLDEGAAVVVQGNTLRSIGDGAATLLTARSAGKVSVLYRMDEGDTADVHRFAIPGGESQLGVLLRAPEVASNGK